MTDQIREKCEKEPKPFKVWELVREMEMNPESAKEGMMEAKATLLVNYGPDGHNTKGWVDESQTLFQMVITVCQNYHEALMKRDERIAQHEIWNENHTRTIADLQEKIKELEKQLNERI